MLKIVTVFAVLTSSLAWADCNTLKTNIDKSMADLETSLSATQKLAPRTQAISKAYCASLVAYNKSTVTVEKKLMKLKKTLAGFEKEPNCVEVLGDKYIAEISEKSEAYFGAAVGMAEEAEYLLNNNSDACKKL